MLFDSHAHLNNRNMTEEDRLEMVAQIEATMKPAVTAEPPASKGSSKDLSDEPIDLADKSKDLVDEPIDLTDKSKDLSDEPIESAENAANPEPVTAEAPASLDYVMDIGFDPESSALAVEHAQRYPWCYAAVGCHPHDAKIMDEEQLDRIRALAGEAKVCAIGEIGLDFHYDLSDRDVQREWFRRQIRLANELRMPICIHAREADQEVMDILREEGAFSEERRSWFPRRPDPTAFCKGRSAGYWEESTDSAGSATDVDKTPAEASEGSHGTNATRTAAEDLTKTSTGCSTDVEKAAGEGGPVGMTGDARVLLHCFSGSAELGKEYVRMGATLSVAGPVTYKNNKKTVAMVDAIPIDFLLVETDSPYLSPVPMRGKPNTPPNVEYTARKVAEIKGLSFEETAAKTKENAMRFYGISD